MQRTHAYTLILMIGLLVGCTPIPRPITAEDEAEYLRSLPTYIPSQVVAICEQIFLPSDDPFCSPSIAQNAETFLPMFSRRFPDMRYETVMPVLERYTMNSRCLGKRIEDICPPPTQCRGGRETSYTCYFDLVAQLEGSTIGYLELRFDVWSGEVVSLRASLPNDDS